VVDDEGVVGAEEVSVAANARSRIERRGAVAVPGGYASANEAAV
jgi:hypothetical protein